MNQIRVIFYPCSPSPENGYNIQWRVLGSSDPYTDAGNFLISPAFIQDNSNPDGTQYEGFIRSSCCESGESGESGECFGTEIPWETAAGESGESGDPTEEFGYYLADEYACDDCAGAPTQSNILVRLPIAHSVQVGKFYRPVGHPTGFVYALSDIPQSPASSIPLTVDNFTTCTGGCGAG